MVGKFTIRMTMYFWATPHHAIYGAFAIGGACAERALLKLVALTPGFPHDDPPPDPPPRPARDFPTDVPVPEPRDVPVPEPRDVPPPEPGRTPPTQSPKYPQPRPVP